MKTIREWTSASTDETEKIAQEIADILKPGDIVLLQGNLGSGKTFLVQKICAAWEVSETVTSPTFTLIQHYNSGQHAVIHMDLYRLDNISQLDQLGWEDLLFAGNITFVEWPELIKPVLSSYYLVTIDSENGTRKLRLSRREGE